MKRLNAHSVMKFIQIMDVRGCIRKFPD